jgi:hypothetical protein
MQVDERARTHTLTCRWRMAWACSISRTMQPCPTRMRRLESGTAAQPPPAGRLSPGRARRSWTSRLGGRDLDAAPVRRRRAQELEKSVLERFVLEEGCSREVCPGEENISDSTCTKQHCNIFQVHGSDSTRIKEHCNIFSGPTL